MAKRPITRYYNFGVTFRWTRGDSHIVVKRGYVCEGRAVIVLKRPSCEVRDRPGEDPHNDRETWVAAIPVDSNRWEDDRHFINTARKWAFENPGLVDLKKRTDRTRR